MLNNPHRPPLASETETAYADTRINIEMGVGNPFPGLRPFSIEESHLFFGREGQVDEILLKLAQNRFVTVMGYSGSGKSSLMYCGLVPVLYGGFVTETGPNWTAVLTRPGASPIDTLAESIIHQLADSGKISVDDKDLYKSIVTSLLRSGQNGLVEVCKFIQRESSENIFILVDQFEELLRFTDPEDLSQNEAQVYVNLILTAVSQKEFPIYIALTMRSDFIGYCSVFPGLTQWINNSNYLVPQMTREQKRMVIEGPIAVAGGRISPRLVKRLLSDVGNNQDQLPILQHALMRTWDYWLSNREANEAIDLRHYQAVGKMSEALSLHANEAYEELTTRGKEIAEILFKSITEKNQENKGMRKPARLGLIAQLCEAEEDDVIDVVEHFRKPGRSLLMPGAGIVLNGDSMIELSHESLMRIWKRLSMWVDEEFESAQMYKRLSEAAAMYQIGKTGLWRPPDLQLALNWQKKQRPSREWAQRYDEAFERAIVFLDTSRITYEAELKNQEMLQRRVLRRTRATAVILGVAFVVAILFFVLSYIQKINADEQTRIAEAQRQEANLQRENALRQTAEADKQKRIAEQVAKQLEENYSVIQEAYRRADYQRERAEAALVRAKEEEQKAIAASEEEKIAKELALDRTRYAREQYTRANALFMLALAQSLATKSVQVDDDSNLKGLLAMQAYRYHTNYEGKKYDPYIYEGLYSSLAKLKGSRYNAIKVAGPPHVHIKSLVVSQDENFFYTAGADGRILKGDFATLSITNTPFANKYPSRTIALSKDENFLINGSDSLFLQVFDLRDAVKEPSVVKGLTSSVNDIEFFPDGRSYIVATSDKSLMIGKLGESTVKPLVALPYELKSLSVHPRGHLIAGATWSGQVVLIDGKNLQITIVANDQASRVLSVEFNPDGTLLAFGVDDIHNKRGLVKLYDLVSKETRQFSGHKAGVTDVEFSPDGKLLASAGSDKRVLLWLLDNPEELPITMTNNSGFIWDIAFTRSSKYLIASCSESEIRVWPTDPAILADEICPKLTRNLTADEWNKYVGKGEMLQYESTCETISSGD